MDSDPLQRLDTYPYRHRVHDVMTRPLVTIEPTAKLRSAANLMLERAISSLIVDPKGQEGGPGIITERDLLQLVAAEGAQALELPCAEIMSRPLLTVPADAYLFVAIGRMHRLQVRHLVALDEHGRPSGMLTARALLGQRAREALALGDEIAGAVTVTELREVQQGLVGLARGLLQEKVAAPDIAGIIAAVLRDITARAAELAAQAMVAEGLGPAPAPWAMLVLGSGGRGESLLSADQDNAIVHGGDESRDDAWFESLGRRVADTLDAVGIPYCKGGVMAANAPWRRSLAGWRQTIGGWVDRSEGASLLNVDIFYDFHRACGDAALAEALRNHAVEVGRRPLLPRMLGQQLENLRAPIGLFGGLVTQNGRLDLKFNGLFPIVAGARAMALKLGEPATDTAERLQAVRQAGLINEEDLQGLLEARELFMRLILEQQIADLQAGLPAATRIDPQRLTATRRARLKEALQRAAAIAVKVSDVVQDG